MKVIGNNLIVDEKDVAKVSTDMLSKEEVVPFSDYESIISEYQKSKERILFVKEGINQLEIKYSDVEKVKIYPSGYNHFSTGFFVGLGIDVLLVAIVLSSVEPISFSWQNEGK